MTNSDGPAARRRGGAGSLLDAADAYARIVREGSRARVDSTAARLLVIIPDGTRTMPMPLMFDVLERRSARAPRRSTTSSRSAPISR